MKSPKRTSSTPFIRVGPSGVHGLGAFATRDLPAEAFLGLYEGRRYTRQEVASKLWDDQLTYLFTLTTGETIDGAKGGNATRHLNHSCEPNCEAVEEYDEAGEMVLRFQTMEAVEAGDELFIDYSLTADDGSPPSKYPCHCGSPNCRGTMLAPVEAVAEKDGPATPADVAPAVSDPRRPLSELPW
ncbi:SET domain-containing protein [Variovorax boronicumulans]|uniref:SET domain-containing protein n=1 Tax=Variovorax boronicumulans TaxID=436515 RepID=UPI0012E66821|nr:SET domain-containing protein-lysine N-methyltransferase [Variovorax boronicumulans]GER10308.1 SET domain-containing protein-lysine N-methyltransferase [Variovorax boronicumulans]